MVDHPAALFFSFSLPTSSPLPNCLEGFSNGWGFFYFIASVTRSPSGGILWMADCPAARIFDALFCFCIIYFTTPQPFGGVL